MISFNLKHCGNMQYLQLGCFWFQRNASIRLACIYVFGDVVENDNIHVLSLVFCSLFFYGGCHIEFPKRLAALLHF